ncbi:hypothetical protein LCGC14_0717990 [marine sediment metagenome]|uniref:Uncharacterized protein n=1 Tax=marine sediment metagenome TaxID=412755 RepID=A0A0F9QHH9_9ZZZZ
MKLTKVQTIINWSLQNNNLSPSSKPTNYGDLLFFFSIFVFTLLSSQE